MTGIESGALRLAKVVVTQAAKNWLGDRSAKTASHAPLASLPHVRSVRINGCPGPLDLTPLREAPALEELVLLENGQPIDLRPLAERTITLLLSKNDQIVGLDQLGPEVRIDWLGQLGGKTPKVREE